jgi:hypothetical protein
MKRPVNFEKIDAVDFEMLGNYFYTDLDNLQNKKESSWVWVFCNGQILGDYAILFEFKWEHDCYSMKKCVLGEGTTGDYIFQDNWISEKWIKTKDECIEYIKRLISSEIKVGVFKN